MNAKELRIGNLLNYTTAENDIELAKLDWQDLKWISEDEKGFNLVHDPIPLTEEWLIRLGFELMYTGTNRKVYDFPNDFRFGYTDNHGFKNISSGVTYRGDKIDPVKYVHQLQNLFFALSGEELTYANLK